MRACGGDEKSIAIAQCECLADVGRAGIHQERPRFAVRLRIGACVVELKIAAAEIERAVAGPRELHHVDPFLRIVVALVMLALLDAEHVELAFVPADDNVYADAALADMISGDELLGSDQRMKQRRMNGAEHSHVLGRAQEPDRPGDRLKRAAVKIGIAAIALPARDRQHEIEPSLVTELCQLKTIRPARRPAFRHLGGRASRRAIGAE